MKPCVLIVDDSLTVRMDLGEPFESAGFVNTLCSSVAEARSALSTGSFALIILDVLLPDGNGIELLQEIKNTAATAKTPVMLLSSEAEVRDRIRDSRRVRMSTSESHTTNLTSWRAPWSFCGKMNQEVEPRDQQLS